MAFSVHEIWKEWWELILRGAILIFITIPFMLSGDALSRSKLKYKEAVSRIAVLFGLVVAFVTAFYIPTDWILDFKVWFEGNIVIIIIVLFVIFIIAALIHKKR